MGAAAISADTSWIRQPGDFATFVLPFNMAIPCDQLGPVQVEGKFFCLGDRKCYVKGFAYGPFPPNGGDEFLPDCPLLNEDFAHMRRLGANAVRLYHPPQRWLLDDALRHGLLVLIDVPWQKHRCFFRGLDGLGGCSPACRGYGQEPGRPPSGFRDQRGE